jgi:hypothetical protein
METEKHTYEEDFVDEKLIEFEIDGRKFKYKPTTAGDENDWLDEYVEVGADGKPKQNFKKVNECKIRNLVEVPYSVDLIEKQIGIKKVWKDLNNKEKWKFISKLTPSMFDKIIRKLNEIDSPEPEQKKN